VPRALIRPFLAWHRPRRLGARRGSRPPREAELGRQPVGQDQRVPPRTQHRRSQEPLAMALQAEHPQPLNRVRRNGQGTRQKPMRTRRNSRVPLGRRGPRFTNPLRKRFRRRCFRILKKPRESPLSDGPS
jgi:hypothetical protein